MRITSILFLTLFAGQASAACQSGTEVFMSCTVQSGAKAVRVCASSKVASYSFGPTGRTPELALTVPVGDIRYEPWPGVGSSIFESVTFYNGAVAYEVFAGMDRRPADGKDPHFGGINVYEDDDQIAGLLCDAGTINFPWTDVLSR